MLRIASMKFLTTIFGSAANPQPARTSRAGKKEPTCHPWSPSNPVLSIAWSRQLILKISNNKTRTVQVNGLNRKYYGSQTRVSRFNVTFFPHALWMKLILPVLNIHESVLSHQQHTPNDATMQSSGTMLVKQTMAILGFFSRETWTHNIEAPWYLVMTRYRSSLSATCGVELPNWVDRIELKSWTDAAGSWLPHCSRGRPRKWHIGVPF